MKTRGAKPWVILVCVMALMFLPNYAQYQLSPLAYLIIPEYGLDAVRFSALFSATMVFGALLSLFSGMLCDRYGTRRVIGVAAVVSAIAVVVRTFVTSFVPLFTCMVFSGFVAAFINSNTAKIMGVWFKPERVGVAVGISVAGATLGMTVGMGTTALFPSVKAAFAFAAVFALVVVFAWWTLFQEKPPRSDEDCSLADEAAPGFAECLKTVARNRNVWLVGIALAMDMASLTCIASFLPQALQAVRGVDPASAGTVSSAITLGNLAGAVLAPAINARIGRLKPFTMAIAAIAALGGAFTWQLPLGAMAICLFVTGFCLGGIMSSLMAVPVLLPEIGPAFAGTAGGMAATLQLLGAIVFPSCILTPLAGGDYTMLFGLAGALCLVAVLCIAFLPELLKRD